MGQIDVTDVINDPDFSDPMSIVDRKSIVNALGENIVQETTLSTFGCIEPVSGRTIQRIPEAMRVNNMSSFWFRGIIVASAPGKYSSILVFRGQRYQVVTVFDWSNFGQGYCEGLCVAEAPCP